MKSDMTLNRVVEFHGHLCPGLAYGYRVAGAALEILGDPAEDEEIAAVVENNSCAVDAIQVMTGCTFGKGNLIFRDYGKQVYTFFSRKNGKGIRISVIYSRQESPDEKTIWKRVQEGDSSSDLEEKIRKIKIKKVEEILRLPQEKLLAIRDIHAPLPPKARLYPTVRCEQCGEKVMGPRIREISGRKFCIPCTESQENRPAGI